MSNGKRRDSSSLLQSQVQESGWGGAELQPEPQPKSQLQARAGRTTRALALWLHCPLKTLPAAAATPNSVRYIVSLMLCITCLRVRVHGKVYLIGRTWSHGCSAAAKEAGRVSSGFWTQRTALPPVLGSQVTGCSIQTPESHKKGKGALC